MYLVLDKNGNVFYEAGSLEEAQHNCPQGHIVVKQMELRYVSPEVGYVDQDEEYY
jgi:hypothetical protein